MGTNTAAVLPRIRKRTAETILTGFYLHGTTKSAAAETLSALSDSV
jgi:hypothetical protein